MTDLHETVLSSEPIYRGKLVHLYRDTVRLPDGTAAEREIIHHPGAVAMVPLLGEDAGELRVVLVRQFRAAVQRPMLEIPAGTLEPGEDPLSGATRELQEEIRFRPGKLERLAGEYTAPGYTTELIHLYLATALTPSALTGDADEFIDVVTLPLKLALQMVDRGEIEDGKTLIGLLLTARRLGL